MKVTTKNGHNTGEKTFMLRLNYKPTLFIGGGATLNTLVLLGEKA